MFKREEREQFVSLMRREALFEEGEERVRDRGKKRTGIPAKRVAEEIKRGGRIKNH